MFGGKTTAVAVERTRLGSPGVRGRDRKTQNNMQNKNRTRRDTAHNRLTCAFFNSEPVLSRAGTFRKADINSYAAGIADRRYACTVSRKLAKKKKDHLFFINIFQSIEMKKEKCKKTNLQIKKIRFFSTRFIWTIWFVCMNFCNILKTIRSE